MINSLNSIIIEGNVDGEVGLWDTDKGKEGVFEVLSTRWSGRECLTLRVQIYTYGNLAESCHQYLESGRGVRVVGRLESYPGDKLAIRAEHCEFTVKKKVQEKESA